jgi:hypothetical protein
VFHKLTLGLIVLFCIAVVQAGSVEATASSISAKQACTANGLDLQLTWRNGRSRVVQQYVDLSFVSNGWVPGTYTPHGPLDGEAEALVIQSVVPGTAYYLRINQQLAGGTWYATETLRIRTSSCGLAPAPGQSAVPANQFYEPLPEPPRRSRDDGLRSLLCWLLGCSGG